MGEGLDFTVDLFFLGLLIFFFNCFDFGEVAGDGVDVSSSLLP